MSERVEINDERATPESPVEEVTAVFEHEVDAYAFRRHARDAHDPPGVDLIDRMTVSVTMPDSYPGDYPYRIALDARGFRAVEIDIVPVNR